MSYHYQLTKQYILSLVIMTVILVGGLMGVSVASAQVGIPGTIELNGYAWSSTIGWISLNCKTGGNDGPDAGVVGDDICGTANYQVRLTTAGNLVGYAWSSNIGWIRFGGLSGFPTAPGNSAVNASVTGTYPTLTFAGWIRACAGTLSAVGGCSNMASRTDGWDGWISLRGANAASTYTITTDSAGLRASSYAWGSTNVGWIDMFSRVIWDAPTANVTGVPCTIPRGESNCEGRLTWVINPTTVTNPSLYRLSPNPNQLSAVRTGTNVPVTLEHGMSIFLARSSGIELDRVALTADCESGQPMSAGVCPNLPPALTIATNREIVRIGETVAVDWTITGLLDGTCTLAGPGLSGDVTGSGTLTSGTIHNYSTFSISCSGSYGEVTATDAIEVIPSTQEI